VIAEIQDGIEISAIRMQPRRKSWRSGWMRSWNIIDSARGWRIFREWARMMADKSDDLSGDAMIAQLPDPPPDCGNRNVKILTASR